MLKYVNASNALTASKDRLIVYILYGLNGQNCANHFNGSNEKYIDMVEMGW